MIVINDDDDCDFLFTIDGDCVVGLEDDGFIKRDISRKTKI